MSLLGRRDARSREDSAREMVTRDVDGRDRGSASPPMLARSQAVSALEGDLRADLRGGIFSTCANLRCRSGWLHLWRRRETPVFEGGWCCSRECMSKRVALALNREMDGRGSPREGHRHRIPLGLVLLEQGWITNEQLRAALAAQKNVGAGRLGSWLVRGEGASEENVTRALALQWGCPVLGMESHHPEGLTAFLPRLFVDAFGVLPLRVAANRILYLGFEDHLDPALALAVERMTGLEVVGGLVRESEFRPAHARLLEARFPAAELIEVATEPALAAAFAKSIEQSRPLDSRLVRVHDCFWLRMRLKPEVAAIPEPGAILDLIGSVRSL